jgi:hypothetical protein
MLATIAGVLLKIIGGFNLICATINNIGMVCNFASAF